MKDLFEYPHEIPNKVNNVLANYDQEETNLSYEECARLVKDLNSIGYTCDYGLDGIPFDLRKIKEYNLDILTEQGPKTVFFTDLQPIEETEKAIVLKYGTFTTLKCTQL